MLRRLAPALLLALAALPAAAEPELAATATCHGEWVNVTVDAPGEGWLLFRKPGQSWVQVAGRGFVPDVGGGAPASDYDIDIEVEQRDSVDAVRYTVLRRGTVHTPSCGAPSTTTSTTTTTTVAAPAVEPQVSVTSAKLLTIVEK